MKNKNLLKILVIIIFSFYNIGCKSVGSPEAEIIFQSQPSISPGGIVVVKLKIDVETLGSIEWTATGGTFENPSSINPYAYSMGNPYTAYWRAPQEKGIYTLICKFTDISERKYREGIITIDIEVVDLPGKAVSVNDMRRDRIGFSAVRLNDGSVLVAGGVSYKTIPNADKFTAFTSELVDFACAIWGSEIIKNWEDLSIVEKYMPSLKKFIPLSARLNLPGCVTNSILLEDGNVLITGDDIGSGNTHFELFDSVFESFIDLNIKTEKIITPYYHELTYLGNKRVLLSGTHNESSPGGLIYDGNFNTLTETGSLNYKRYGHTATLLNDGRVLIVGGKDVDGFGTRISELYYPEDNLFKIGPEIYNEYFDNRLTATTLQDGRVLIIGKQAHIFEPTQNSIRTIDGPNVPRYSHTSTLLPDGRVLIVGGLAFTEITDRDIILPTIEIFDPSTETFSYAASLWLPRFEHKAVLLDDGSVLIIGGANVPQTAEIYFP